LQNKDCSLGASDAVPCIVDSTGQLRAKPLSESISITLISRL
jgi:hypothetical protein